MKNITQTMKWFVVPMLVLALMTTGCKKTYEPTGSNGDNSDIPANPTNNNVPTTTINNIIPSATFTRTSGNENRIQMNLLGIINPSTGSAIQFNSSNVFVVEDGTLKGIKITSAGGGVTLKADVVFVVDNSGSMSEEADSIASKIIAFSNYLQQSGMDVKVGCVGHGYNSDQYVYGAQNLTDASKLATYLNRAEGLERTYGYSGSDSSRLANAASQFGPQTSSGGENSIVGIKFADQYFSWRPSANRVYIIFTDEPTQPANMSSWTTDGFKSQWDASRGTIHCVFSEDSTYYSWSLGYDERPWTLADITGGTQKFITPDAAGLNLTTLPVTGALSKSYLLEYLTSNPSGTHTITIVVKVTGADGSVTYYNISYQ